MFFRANTFDEALDIIRKIVFDRRSLFIADHNWLMVYSFVFIMVLMVSEFFIELGLSKKFSLYNSNNTTAAG